MARIRAVALCLVLLLVGAGTPDGADAQEDPVRRIGGGERTMTAALVARDAWTTADDVVIVDGWDHVAALVGAHLAARLDAPVLLSGAEVPPSTADELRRLQPDRVVVVGDVAAPALDDVEEIRIRSDDPAELAVAALAVRADGPAGEALPVVVVASETFADALSAADLAPAQVLMTPAGRLPEPTRRAITERAPDAVTVLGGTAAVSSAVVDAIRDLGPDVTRVAGPTRYETAVTGAEGTGATTVVIAAGHTFADAVAFVPWAARQDAALVLSPRSELHDVAQAHLREGGYTNAVVAGGTAALGSFVVDQATAAITGAPPPGFTGSVRSLTAAERTAMTGVSWHDGCPVGLDDLRVVDVDHWDFTGNVRSDGQLIVHAAVAEDVRRLMEELFDARFPLESVRPVREHSGDDDASMAANNSSAFNCRVVGGTTRWSEHAYGSAIDLNPVQNPYVRGVTVAPPAGGAFTDRDDVRPGMIVRPGRVVDAFAAIGWAWGADFSNSDDYQHFSASGR